MADHQTTVALNIGSQRISLAVFETSKSGGLTLKAYASELIDADPLLDASRIQQAQSAVNRLVHELNLSHQKVRYSISGQSVFTRFVKLPSIQDDDLDKLVTFEAQQHVPFPLQEVVWDYELITGGSEKEAVIVAIKSDALDEINAAVNASGLGTCEVDVAPMALYNAFRSTYGEPDEPTLLIDIGAKTTNLLYIEGERFFTRSLAIGGAAITAAIAKEYNVSFAEAEHQKITNGLVALGGGHTELLGESVAALSMVIRNTMSRLPAEIARTTNYYRSQHGGNAPRRILLAGGGSNLPYTLEFFHEKLNLPVAFFNPLRNVLIGKGVDAELMQTEAHIMGELIGLGLRGIGKSNVNIDLVPWSVEMARVAARRRPYWIAAASTLMVGTALWSGFQWLALANGLEQSKAMLEQRDALRPYQIEISQLLKKESALREIASGYVTAETDHVYWMDLLSEIRGAFASDSVWLVNIEPVQGYNPLAAKATDKGKVVNGRSLLKMDVSNTPYGVSALIDAQPAVDPKTKPEAAGGKTKNVKNANTQTADISFNAVRVKGFWRENPKSQNVVSELINKLRQHSEVFTFIIKDEKGKDKTLNIEQILDLTVTGKPGEFGMPFEVVLPLKKEFVVK